MRSLRLLCFAAIQSSLELCAPQLVRLSTDLQEELLQWLMKERKWGSRALTAALVPHFFTDSAAHLDFESMWLSHWRPVHVCADELLSLNLRCTLINADITHQLRAPHLRCLQLEGVHGLKEAHLQSLARFEQLQTLSVEIDGIADEPVKRLVASLPHLRSLHLGRATGLTSVDAFAALTALTLCDAVQLTRISLPAATSIELHGCSALKAAEFGPVTHLSLSNCNVLRDIQLPPQLTRLQLLHCPRLRVDGALPAALRYLSLSSMKMYPVDELPPQLEELYVWHSKTFLPLPPISHLPLRHLALVNCIPSAPCATITRLTISHCTELGDAELAALVRALPALHRLDLTACPTIRSVDIHSDLLRAFVAPDCHLVSVCLRCAKLKTLDLSRGPAFVSDSSTCLQSLRKLFAIGAAYVTNAWLERVMSACRDTLALLNCSETALTWSNAHVRGLVHAFPRLRRLYLNHCNVALDFNAADAELPARVNVTCKHLSSHL